jgi:hypothetical protein
LLYAIFREEKEKKAGLLHRTATTTYPCCLPALGGSAGAGRVRPAGRKDKGKQEEKNTEFGIKV